MSVYVSVGGSRVAFWSVVLYIFLHSVLRCFIKNIKNESFHNSCIINYISRSPTFWGNAEQSGILWALNTNVTVMQQSWAHVLSPPTFHTQSIYISLSLTPSALLKVLNFAATLGYIVSWLWYTVSLNITDCLFYCFLNGRVVSGVRYVLFALIFWLKNALYASQDV